MALGPFLSKRLNPRFQIPVFKFDRLLAASIPPPEQNPRFELENPRFFGDLGKSKKTYLNPLFKTGIAFLANRNIHVLSTGAHAKAYHTT